MRPVILNRLRIEILMVRLVVENLGNNNFWRDVFAVLVLMVRIAICCVALGPRSAGGRITEAGRIEERMCLVDPGVDIPNLDPGTGDSSSARGRPRSLCINNFVALAQVRVIKGVRLNSFNHGCSSDRLMSCP